MKMKKYCKKILALTLAAVLAIPFVSSGYTVRAEETETVEAVEKKSLPHEKATPDCYVKGTPGTIKGLQGTELGDMEGIQALADMNVHQIMLNVDLADIIDPTHTGTPYVYNGKTYYFNDGEGSMMKVYETRIRQYREYGVNWTFCLLLSDGGETHKYRNEPEITNLMFNYQPDAVDGMGRQSKYYALNVFDPVASEQIAATFHYMAEYFGYKDTFVQHWRVGNEVNVAHYCNYSGAGSNGIPLESTLVDLAVQSYNILNQALKDENPYAKAFVSVTHDWNNNNEGTSVPTKDFIDMFAAKVSDKDWNIDFHAYPPQMFEQVWTQNSAAYLAHDVLSFSVCAPNLEVMTDYVKAKEGNHRIILSEQSYDSRYGEEEQAAMIAYTYYAAARCDMIDAVTFTTYKDSGSIHHDGYLMGIVNFDGTKKKSYDVFKYMDTDLKGTYVDPYLAKLSAWTGRTISSWSDDILYKAPATTATLTLASLYYPLDQQDGKSVYIGLTTEPKKTEVDLEYKWEIFNYTTKKSEEVSAWKLNAEWLRWYPTENATYNFKCTVRVAGNPSSVMSDSMDIVVNVAGLPDSVPPAVELPEGEFAQNDGYRFVRDAAGDVRCYNIQTGVMLVNDFRCDGTYTYYFQADGTAMKDRLTYHPDGIHVIYFDQYGHEVFSDFANVKKSIAGDAVDDMCFFNVYGYMYVDTLTYDKTGTKLYYVNPYGVLERTGWFAFSGNEFDAGLGFSGRSGGYGYANSDCSLVTNTYTYDWDGNYVYLQGDGHMFR